MYYDYVFISVFDAVVLSISNFEKIIISKSNNIGISMKEPNSYLAKKIKKFIITSA